MFGLFKKRKVKDIEIISRLPFKIDFHSHILPGIDDGSPDIETSLELITGMQELGIEKFIATPHIIGDIYRNDQISIFNALEKLKSACVEAGLQVEISAAAEYMLDDYFISLLRKNEKLLTLKDNLILTEMSYAVPTGNIHEIAFEILSSGYKPILAHPERYNFLHHNLQEYEHLKELGFMFQMNVLSITGYYGVKVAKIANYLLSKNQIDFISSDIHHTKHVNFIKNNMGIISSAVRDKQLLNELLN